MGRGRIVGSKNGEFESLVGRRYGNLTVISYAGRERGRRNSTWNCLCDCGQGAVAVGSRLKAGQVRSCGCYRYGGQIALKHGHSSGGIISPEYRAWQAIRRRCYNQNEVGYPRYGGRGIKVCDSWNNSFEAFLADVGQRPSKKHSLGRINNDGDYEPSNVQWETPLQQGANNSRNRNFTIEGRTMHLAAWVRERGMVLNTVHRRLKRGQSIEAALELVEASKLALFEKCYRNWNGSAVMLGGFQELVETVKDLQFKLDQERELTTILSQRNPD